jgi:CRP/FNR family transcriptional regulator, anaerobic regulatory protein
MASKKPTWLGSFPALYNITDTAWQDVAESARLITVQAGMPLYRDREACENYLVILDGSVRVQKLAASGQVITLYHLEAGQSCELTTTCLLGGASYPAEAVAETQVRAALIPKTEFLEAMFNAPQFRDFVFSSLDRGINDLITLVEQVAFGHMDGRLAHCLVSRAGAKKRLRVTHMALAEELGTAREVVSRLLKEFERQGWVRLHRGWIEIGDLHSLRALASQTIV